jgi:hypothetical protein
MNAGYLRDLLAANETILLSTKQHGFVFFQKIFIDLILIIVLVVGLIFLMPTLGSLSGLGFFLAIIPLVDMLRNTLDWINRQYIITNRRVIQVSGIINKNVTDSSLEKVNDVKLSQSFWGRIFGYGDVEILTASELGTNRFNFIGDPLAFKKIMMDAKNRINGNLEDGFTFKNVIKEQTIPDLIVELDALRIKGIISEEEFREKKKDLLSRM